MSRRGRPRKVSAERAEQVAAAAVTALQKSILDSVVGYLSSPLGLRHELEVIDAHIGYLKKAKPKGWKACVEALIEYKDYCKSLLKLKPRHRSEALREDMASFFAVRSSTAIAVAPLVHLTDAHLQALELMVRELSREPERYLISPWLVTSLFVAMAMYRRIRGEQDGTEALVDSEFPQAEIARKGLGQLLQRPPKLKSPDPVLQALGKEWLQGQREGREIPIRELAERYLGPEYHQNPEAATRRVKRFLAKWCKANATTD